MEQYIDKSALAAKIKNRIKELQNLHKENEEKLDSIQKTAILLCIDECKVILSFLDTLEVKDVVEEQEGVCNGIFNRIIGDNWNLSIPLDKTGLKHGDKVKIFITKENK